MAQGPDIDRSLPRKFGYALAGIAHGFKTQLNLRIHAAVAVVAVIAAIVLKVPAPEFLLIGVLIAAVISAELFNTAIESVVDLASPQVHPLAKAAKDCAAGAVLVLAIASVVLGLIIYIRAGLALIG